MTIAAMTHTFRSTLPATRERVFSALTTVPDLTAWFAEHAAVTPAAGGAFAFWGRYTYGTPEQAHATQQLTRFDPPHAISFSWTIDGVATEVTWAVSEKDDAADQSVLDVTHVFEHRPHAPAPEALVDDLWRLHLGNLAAHLTGMEVLRPDFADPAPVIRQSIVINAPAERVFRALTEPAALNRWVAKDAHVDLVVGGRYDWGWTIARAGQVAATGPTTILALEPNVTLVTDWPDWRGDPTRPKSRVTWLLEPLGEARTRVTLVHDGFERAADLSDYPFGWSYFLGQLQQEAESPARR